MKKVVEMLFGSHIYGTNVPTSDKDYKCIYLPKPRDILLQKVKGTKQDNTNNDQSRNTKDDVDIEYFTYDKYLQLLLQGQTVALDMLFCPDHFIVGGDNVELWKEIQKNKDQFIHSGVLSFIGYCRTQANKYGIKGSRMNTVKSTIDLLKEYKDELRIEDVDLTELLKLEHANMVECMGPNNKMEPHLEVCNRKIGMRTKVEYARLVFQKIYDGYGHRARLAAKNEGVDWKALMHAVRVQYEAKELLLTGHITFPRPEKDLLLKIRKEELSYAEVAEIIEQGLDELEEMDSNLPDKPNYKLAEDMIVNTYYNLVTGML